jgi:putative tricarboxylic transport membrane protein
MAAWQNDANSVKFAGGSARGSMDHLVPAMVVKSAGFLPKKLKYIPYDGGGKAMAALLSGEVTVLSTGLSEAIGLQKDGAVRILAMTGDSRSDGAPGVPTVKELGYDTTFVNWRGFFAAPGISDAKKAEYVDLLAKMYDTEEWEKVRLRYGWSEIFIPDDKVIAFLENQEKVMKSLMLELGFLK